jgi:tetratricopeptide (TPR) repeat protein
LKPGPGLGAAWAVAIGAAAGVRLWNALAGPMMWGYDAWGHVSYALFLDAYRALPWADQGWSYFHPPLHYALGWGLARFGSAEVLVRGLALLGGAAGLGLAALAAWIARAACPRRLELGIVAFGAVAFLPAQIAVAAMPGNEMTQSLFSGLALAVFIAHEGRPRPALALDALTGALLGLALLTKANGWVALVSVCAARVALDALGRRVGRLTLARLALTAGVALLMAAPIYARNLQRFGTPLPSSGEFELVRSVERRQPPGHRTWRDYVAFPAGLFSEPDPAAPHLLHSVWGSLYLNAWSDSQREDDVAPTPDAVRRERRVRSLLALCGLLPSGLAALGAGLAAADVRRGRRRRVYVPLLVLSAVGLAALVRFTWQIPTFAALKVSYVLPLSLAWAAFLCRGVEAATDGWPGLRPALFAALGAVAAAATWASASGAALPRRADAPAMGAVYFYFGEHDAARRIYQRLVEGAPGAVPWLENLAAVELADGNPQRAQRLLARAAALAGGAPDAYRSSRQAVASALAGDLAGAQALLDAALAAEPLPELLANRGAIRARRGDVGGAEEDLRAALEAGPELTAAAYNLARLLSGAERGAEAEAARARAAELACRAPRGHPHAVGTGEILEWGVGRRALLLLSDAGLEVAGPAFYRSACARLGDGRGGARARPDP